jgi:hypothetical protein
MDQGTDEPVTSIMVGAVVAGLKRLSGPLWRCAGGECGGDLSRFSQKHIVYNREPAVSVHRARTLPAWRGGPLVLPDDVAHVDQASTAYSAGFREGEGETRATARRYDSARRIARPRGRRM